jgi:hypothetical protein
MKTDQQHCKVSDQNKALYCILLVLSHMFGYVEQKLLGRSQKSCFSFLNLIFTYKQSTGTTVHSGATSNNGRDWLGT